MNKQLHTSKITPHKEVQLPIERCTQKPTAHESNHIRELLNHPDSKLQILPPHHTGKIGFDTPRLSKHNQAVTFMVSLLPVNIQNGIQTLFAKRFPEYATEQQGSIFFHGHSYNENIFFERLNEIVDVDKLPDILITTDLNCLFDVRKKFINQTNFATFSTAHNSLLSGTGMEDVRKIFRFIGADAMVMVVDCRYSLGLSHPGEWYELLNPNLSNRLILCGDTDYYNYTFYLHYIKNYGMEAVKQIHRNTLTRLHPAQMIQAIHNNDSLGAYIYVMPYSWAIKIENKFDYQIVWPKDGAMLIPIQMLVKKGNSEKYRSITRYMGGIEIGNYLRDQGFISTNPRVAHPVQDSQMQWLGWEFIQHSNLSELKKEIRTILTTHKD